MSPILMLFDLKQG